MWECSKKTARENDTDVYLEDVLGSILGYSRSLTKNV
uniref:Transposase n=1 Tax=Heterorhabditis bacteriophora TaxID=37862 RepID=A0A1I7WGK0_HETBA